MEIAVALIAAAAGFAGGYFGSKWNAQTSLSQWQREQLLNYCADLVAAGQEIVQNGRDLQDGKNPAFPLEAAQRLQHAQACIMLLSDKVGEPGQNYVIACLNILQEPIIELPEGQFSTPASQAAAAASGRFLRAAHDFLTNIQAQPTPLQQAWLRIRSNVSAAAVWIGAVQPPQPKRRVPSYPQPTEPGPDDQHLPPPPEAPTTL